MDARPVADNSAPWLIRETPVWPTAGPKPCLWEQMLFLDERRAGLWSSGAGYEIPSAALMLHFYRKARRPPTWVERLRRWFRRWGWQEGQA